MFYIRTADRLQRTSVWMDNLEGGIDYLRQVVIEDSLGIGASWRRKWRISSAPTSVNGRRHWRIRKSLKRFRQFVNSDQPDSGVVFVRSGRGSPGAGGRAPAPDIGSKASGVAQ